jgi:hypothetical protein
VPDRILIWDARRKEHFGLRPDASITAHSRHDPDRRAA